MIDPVSRVHMNSLSLKGKEEADVQQKRVLATKVRYCVEGDRDLLLPKPEKEWDNEQ